MKQPRLEKVLKVNPENQRAHMLFAAVYQRRGNSAGAEKEIRAAIASIRPTRSSTSHSVFC